MYTKRNVCDTPSGFASLNVPIGFVVCSTYAGLLYGKVLHEYIKLCYFNFTTLFNVYYKSVPPVDVITDSLCFCV